MTCTDADGASFREIERSDRGAKSSRVDNSVVVKASTRSSVVSSGALPLACEDVCATRVFSAFKTARKEHTCTASQVSNDLAAYSFADSLLVSTQYVARNKKPFGKQTYWEVDGYQLSGQGKKG